MSSILLLLVVLLVASPAAFAANPIQVENAKAGDNHWTAATQDPVPNAQIDGYATATSVRPGGSIGFHVTTSPVARYRIEIDRLGWYGGSGGRRIGCLVGSKLDKTCSRDELGVEQPLAPSPDPVTGEVDAGWSVTDTLVVPSGWTTGYYLAVFQLTSGPAAGQTEFTPFIVQAPVGDRATILVQVPSNTWQAYNTWGGEDLYTTPQAVKVSFNRPYAHRLLFYWEYQLARYLERGGWDVSYATDDDIDRDPAILLDHALDMTAGHDEYWTKQMRDGWEAARDAGVNLAFMGANTGYWQVRYEDSGGTMVSYKWAPDPDPDPAEKTVQFRDLHVPRPECELEGVQYRGVVIFRQYFDYAVDATGASDPWFAGTGLTNGSLLPGLVGYETDAIDPSCHVPPPIPLLSYSGPPPNNGGPPVRADSVRYTACSGAEVFSAGSLQFSWGLDPWRDPAYTDPRLPPEPPASAALEQAMTQALADLTHSHVPLNRPPHICVPTSTFTASVSHPAVGQTVVFNSTATDKYGEIASQAWDLSGRGDFRDTTGPTASRSFPTPGLFNVSLRVADTSGASSTTTKTIPVCTCPVTSQSARGTSPFIEFASGACSNAAFGTWRLVKHRLRFQPDAGITRFMIRSYSASLQSSGVTRRSLISLVTAHAGTMLPVRANRTPIIIDVSTRADGALMEQQFVLPTSRGNRFVSPGPLNGIACDGTTARVLTPLFGGSSSSPLRVAVTGHGRVTVSVSRSGHAALYRRVLRARAKPFVLSFGARRLSRGAYNIAIATRLSGSSERIVLTALRV